MNTRNKIILFSIAFVFIIVNLATGVNIVQPNSPANNTLTITSPIIFNATLDASPNSDVWTRQFQQNFTNVAGQTITNYTARLNISYDSDMQTNFRDLRIINDSGSSLLFWIESINPGIEAIVWVNIPSSIPGGSTYTTLVQYGNTGASQQNVSGNRVFLNYTGNGSLTAGTTQELFDGSTYINGTAFYTKVDMQTNPGVHQKGMGYNPSNLGTANPWFGFNYFPDAASCSSIGDASCILGTNPERAINVSTYNGNQDLYRPILYTIARNNTASKHLINRNLAYNVTGSSTAYAVGFDSSNADSGTLNWSYAFVNRFVDPEPNTTVKGGETTINESVFSLTNATFYLWRQDILTNKTTKVVTGITANQTIFNISFNTPGLYLWNIEACSQNSTTIVCNFNESNRTLTWGYLNNGEVYNNNSLEGSNQRFVLNLTLGSGVSGNVNLRFNGTSYSTSQTSEGTNTIFSRIINVPEVSTHTNFSFFWDVTLTGNNQDFQFNTTTAQQQVIPLGIDTCGSFTNRILNFTAYDEQFQTFLTGAVIETAVNIYNLDRSVVILNISGQFNNPNNICINQNLVNTSGYSLDSISKYYKNDTHVVEYYNIQNYSLNSSSTTQHIKLYDLNVSSSTDFEFSFIGLDYTPVPDALVFLERQYIPDNDFKTVELPKTDSNGETVLHMVRNDVIYNIRVVKGGVLLGNFQGITAFCDDFSIGNCRIDLAAQETLNETFTYNSQIGLIYSGPEYNSSLNQVRFDFSTTDGMPKEVELDVLRNDVFGNRSVCSTSLTSASGTLTCSIDPDIPETTLVSTIIVNGVRKIISNLNIRGAEFGSIGYVAWFIFTLVIIIIFGENKNALLIGILLSYIGAVALGWSVGSIVGIGAAGIWMIIITLAGIWRVNRRRPQ